MTQKESPFILSELRITVCNHLRSIGYDNGAVYEFGKGLEKFFKKYSAKDIVISHASREDTTKQLQVIRTSIKHSGSFKNPFPTNPAPIGIMHRTKADIIEISIINMGSTEENVEFAELVSELSKHPGHCVHSSGMTEEDFSKLVLGKEYFLNFNESHTNGSSIKQETYQVF